MKPEARPIFGKGVRLRREDDGSAMLLIPEGALVLNPAAIAALALVDGNRTLEDIVTQLVEQFDVTPEQARTDIGALFERLAERRLLSTA